MKNDDELDAELNQLWEKARKELAETPREEAIEFASSDFANFEERDDIEILFSLGLDAIRNPETEQKYKEAAQKATKVTETKGLQQQLEKAKASVEAPAFTLGKKKTPRPSKEEAAQTEKETNTTTYHKVYLGSFTRRFIALTIDIITLSSLTIGISILILQLTEPEYLRELTLNPGHGLPALVLAETALYCLLAGILLFPLLSLLLLKTTPGLSMTGLKILSINGAKPTTDQMTVRALCTPLAVVLNSLAPFTKLKRPFQDPWSNTVVVRKSLR